MTAPVIDLGAAYAGSRRRLADLIRALPDPEQAKAIPVACCPGWSVHDVTAHLASVADDAVSGRLSGPPNDRETAEQVARHAGQPTVEVLDEWEGLEAGVRKLLSAAPVWPLMMDALSHEHDVRAAIAVPGARDLPEIHAGANRLLKALQPEGHELRIEMGDATYGPAEADLILRTSAWEAFRFRLGRRSVNQLRRLDWTGDPSPILDELTIFGPSPRDIVE
jgi:hypothetical protein